MKFAELLSLAKNVPLSSFDWGQDASMYLNHRLPENTRVAIENTGSEVLTKLMSLNPTDLVDLLDRIVTIQGSKLIVAEQQDSVNIVPPPTSTDTVVTVPDIAPASPDPETATKDAVVDKEKSPRWPLVLAMVIVAALITATVVITSDGTRDEIETQRDVTNRSLGLIEKIVDGLLNQSINSNQQQPVVVDPSTQVPQDPNATQDPNVVSDSQTPQQ